jgi:hypothetical protein
VVSSSAKFVANDFPYSTVMLSDISTGGASLFVDLDNFDILDCFSRLGGVRGTLIAEINGDSLPIEGEVCRSAANRLSIKFRPSPRTKLIVGWLAEGTAGDENFMNRVKQTLQKAERVERAIEREMLESGKTVASDNDTEDLALPICSNMHRTASGVQALPRRTCTQWQVRHHRGVSSRGFGTGRPHPGSGHPPG